MAFFNRVNRSKLKLLVSLRFGESYPKKSAPSPLPFATQPFGTYLLENPCGGFVKKPTDFCSNVRLFAVSVKQKKEESGGPILNEKIEAQYVRLVTDEGHSIVPTHQALEQARSLDLDLVLVQGKTDPPVCKIFDFRRVKYEQKKKQKEKAKLKSETSLRKGAFKEVRFSGKTELKDLKMKAAAVKNWMEDGYRVKVVALAAKQGKASQKNLTGDALVKQMEKEQEELKALLASLTSLIEDASIIEYGPVAGNGQAHMIVRHIKFGFKGGGAKKLKEVFPKGKTEGSAISDEDDETDGLISDDNLNELYSISDSPSSIATTASPREPTFPKPLNHRSTLEQNGETPPPFPSEPSPETENRYRTAPRNQVSPRSQRGGGVPSQGGQPPLRPPTTPRGQPQQERNDFGSFSRTPPNKTHRVEPSSADTSKTPASGYGIFSPPKVNTPRIPNAANEENNRYGSPRTKSPTYK